MTRHSDIEDTRRASDSFHCITCSDEALPAVVLSVDDGAGTASVRLQSAAAGTTEVDISLVDMVAPGDVLLCHGGVALSRVEEDGGE
ncbi:MAG TPA: HypC/HybG/HupF family hydrogenase formation chaperone [Chloroflexia bacterium]|nr:HypC/HybG/HupF family hydrogenase formation chaperone [Chloroflexia bacterium]